MKVKCNICGKEEEAVNCMFPGEGQEYLCEECYAEKLREFLGLSHKEKIEDIKRATEKLETMLISPFPVEAVPLNTPEYGISGENDK